MNGKMWIKYLIRFILTVCLGVLATTFNLKAAASNSICFTTANIQGQIDVINSLFAMITAIITIIYIFYQIKKIRKELKK